MEFSLICFIDAAGVYPKVIQAIALRLLCAEPYLAITRLLRAAALEQFAVSHLLAFLPSMRENSVRRNFIVSDEILGEAERVSAVIF